MTEQPSSRVDLLIQRLIDKTRSKQLEWRSALRENAFVAVFDRAGIDIARVVERAAVPDGDHTSVEYYELTILDPGGRVADRYSSNPELSGADTKYTSQDQLGELYRLARSMAMSTESLVEELIGELA
jgi:hypothetical protein